MLRRFVAIGLSTVSAATLMVGAAALPARADIQTDVCADMQNRLIGSSAAVSQARNTLNTATTTLDTKRTQLDAAMVAWITAFGDLVIASDLGVAETISATNTAFLAAQNAVGPKATAWGNAQLAQWKALHAADLAHIVHMVNLTFDTKLTCDAEPPATPGFEPTD